MFSPKPTQEFQFRGLPMNANHEPHRVYAGPEALNGAESFLAHQGRNRPYVYWAALVGCTVALIALPLIHVDVTVQERGRVRPAAERSAIVARMAGFIASIKVRENDLVHAGDTLFVLNAGGLEAKVELNRSQTALIDQELADLDYLLERAGSTKPISVGDLQTAKYISDYQKFDTECTNADLKIARAEREMRRMQQLLADKIVSSREFDQALYEAKLTRVERELIARQTVAQWQADKAQKGIELEQLKTQARQLAEEGNFYSIKAPVDGAVLGLEGVFEGSYVQSGQRMGDISPTSNFVIDALVPPKDIGRIYQGQPVNLQIDAYPYTAWGLLPGRAIRISADYVQESDANNAFKVIVRPDRDYLQAREGLRGSLKKGMTVTARFFVARRSLWELLYESLDILFNPAMNETN
jgi:membrane fusion protein, peptide pheromone/bacteriocin exporter